MLLISNNIHLPDQEIELSAIRAQGATIVFVEHLMRAVVELSDRVAVLNEGKLFALGAPREAMRGSDRRSRRLRG